MRIVFPHSDDDWRALGDAMKYIEAQGWSLGTMQGSAPRGVIFESGVRISKWRNMNPAEQATCDAYLIGDQRYGPLVLTDDQGEVRAR